ncbi:unnamed protein product, partial [Ceratitis capitata]
LFGRQIIETLTNAMANAEQREHCPPQVDTSNLSLKFYSISSTEYYIKLATLPKSAIVVIDLRPSR